MPILLSSVSEQAETILTTFLAWQSALGGKQTHATFGAQAAQLLSAPLAAWPRLLRYDHPSSPFAQTTLREHAQTIVHLLSTIAVPRSQNHRNSYYWEDKTASAHWEQFCQQVCLMAGHDPVCYGRTIDLSRPDPPNTQRLAYLGGWLVLLALLFLCYFAIDPRR